MLEITGSKVVKSEHIDCCLIHNVPRKTPPGLTVREIRSRNPPQVVLDELASGLWSAHLERDGNRVLWTPDFDINYLVYKGNIVLDVGRLEENDGSNLGHRMLLKALVKRTKEGNPSNTTTDGIPNTIVGKIYEIGDSKVRFRYDVALPKCEFPGFFFMEYSIEEVKHGAKKNYQFSLSYPTSPGISDRGLHTEIRVDYLPERGYEFYESLVCRFKGDAHIKTLGLSRRNIGTSILPEQVVNVITRDRSEKNPWVALSDPDEIAVFQQALFGDAIGQRTLDYKGLVLQLFERAKKSELFKPEDTLLYFTD